MDENPVRGANQSCTDSKLLHTFLMLALIVYCADLCFLYLFCCEMLSYFHMVVLILLICGVGLRCSGLVEDTPFAITLENLPLSDSLKSGSNATYLPIKNNILLLLGIVCQRRSHMRSGTMEL